MIQEVRNISNLKKININKSQTSRKRELEETLTIKIC